MNPKGFTLNSLHQADETIALLRAENAALKERVAQLEGVSELGHSLFAKQLIDNDKLKKTITAQTAQLEEMTEAIRVKDEALGAMVTYARNEGKGLRIADEALSIQPSSDILKARDKRVAEACAKVLTMWDASHPVKLAEAIRSGEWEKYL